LYYKVVIIFARLVLLSNNVFCQESGSSRKSLEDDEVERRVFVGWVLNGLWLRANSCHEIDPLAHANYCPHESSFFAVQLVECIVVREINC
jgi:hypothetical protein